MENLLMFGYLPYFGLALFLLIAVFVKLLFAPRYERKSHLVTQAEAKAYQYFERELQMMQFRLFAQVRIADVMGVTGKRNRSWWRAFRQISSKHVDFVLTRPDFSLVACIELDDASHQRKDRIARDRLVNRAFKEAGLPLIRVKPGNEREGLALLKSLIS